MRLPEELLIVAIIRHFEYIFHSCKRERCIEEVLLIMLVSNLCVNHFLDASNFYGSPISTTCTP